MAKPAAEKAIPSSSLYLFVGDAFLIQAEEKKLVTALERDLSGELVRQTFYLSDTPLEKILTEAKTLPFLAAAQFFRIVEAHRAKKDDAALLERYLESPSRTTTLVFECAELDGRQAFAKLLGERGKVLILDEGQARSSTGRFILDKLRRFEKKITPQARRILEEEMGAFPSMLDSVLTQLILYANDRDEIDEAMVELFREKLDEVNAFHITDAIAEQQTARALKLIRELLNGHERDVIGLIGLLHWQVKRLWTLKVMLEDGAPERTIFSKLRISPRQGPFLMRQVRKLERRRLEKAIESLFDLDWKLKTGQAEGATGLESWVVKVTT